MQISDWLGQLVQNAVAESGIQSSAFEGLFILTNQPINQLAPARVPSTHK